MAKVSHKATIGVDDVYDFGSGSVGWAQVYMDVAILGITDQCY